MNTLAVLLAQANDSKLDKGASDVFFLIAAILFALAAIVYLFPLGAAPADGRRGYAPWSGFLLSAGLCSTAIGLLLLGR